MKFGYDRLDWIANWEVGDFVDLDAPQKRQFDARFKQVWNWHRTTQLPLYAHDLRDLASAVGQPLTAAQVEQWRQRSQDHASRTLQELVPGMAAILGTFSDAQVASLLDTMNSRERKEQGKSAKLSVEDLRDEAEDQMAKSLKQWVGSLTKEEKARVHAWSREREYAGTVFQQYQDAWVAAFTQVLAHRSQPDFQKELSEFFDHGRVPYGDEMEKLQEHNRASWVATMADLSSMLTPEQREKLQHRLRDLAGDLSDLSAEPVQAALPGIIG